MYRISPELAEYLLNHAKNPEIPGLKRNELKPYVPINSYSIGVIDPYGSVGVDFEYIIEHQYLIGTKENPEYVPDAIGCWLYKKEELKPPKEPVQIPRGSIDPYTTNPEELFDITDCCVVTPSLVEKLTALKIDTLEKLLEKEPKIKKCLKEKPSSHPWFKL